MTTRKTSLETDFDVQKIHELKTKSDKDLCVGGPSLAALALRNNLVEEIHLFVVPTTISNTIPVIPILLRDIVHKIELIEECRYSEGWVYLSYRIEF